jgi:hypothetical protein
VSVSYQAYKRIGGLIVKKFLLSFLTLLVFSDLAFSQSVAPELSKLCAAFVNQKMPAGCPRTKDLYFCMSGSMGGLSLRGFIFASNGINLCNARQNQFYAACVYGNWYQLNGLKGTPNYKNFRIADMDCRRGNY